MRSSFTAGGTVSKRLGFDTPGMSKGFEFRIDMASLWQDLRYALSIYSRNKAFTLTTVLTMALVLAANTGLFTVVESVLLRPLPYPEPDRITEVLIYDGKFTSSYSGYPWFRFAERDNRAFEYLAVWTPGPPLSVRTIRASVMAQNAIVSSNFFRVFGVQPTVGRGFTRDDDQPGAAPVAVISDSLSRQLFSGSISAIGQAVRLSGESYTVIGVMRPGFNGGMDADVWTTFRKPEDWTNSDVSYLVTGRLKARISLDAARSDLDRVWDNVRTEHPDYDGHRGLRSSVQTYLNWLVGDYRTPMLLISGAAICILVIACINVANLLLAQAASRRKEIALRISLGTTPGRLIRQLLTEALLLAAVCGAAGLALAFLVLSLLKQWFADHLNRGHFISVDARVFLFAAAVTIFTGVAFGLAPAVQLTRVNPAPALRNFGGSTGSRLSKRFRAGLVITQVALSTAILLAAALLLTSFQKLRHHDLGYRPHGVLTVQIALTHPQFRSTARVCSDMQRVMERLRSVPDVQSVAMVNMLPTDFPGAFDVTLLTGSKTASTNTEMWEIPREITPQYFDVMHIPLRYGRAFTDSDTADSAKVAIVNEAFVRKYLGTGNPVGQYLELGRRMGPDFADEPREIVGVVGDTRGERSITREAQPSVYTPIFQVPDRLMAYLNQADAMALVVLTGKTQATLNQEVQQAILGADPALATAQPRPMEEILGAKMSTQRVQTTLVTSFAAIALVLAAVGLYGTMSQAVTDRTTEFGIRSALGATSQHLVRLMIAYSLKLTVAGLSLGTALALAFQRLIASYLFGVRPTDPVVYIAGISVLALTALVATLGPAFRAASVHPRILLEQ